MDIAPKDYPTELLAAPGGPCLSLYQPTHRHFPDNRQDPIRFRNLVKELAQSVRQRAPQQTAELLEPLEALAADREFWNCTLDGLAVLRSYGFFRVFRLQRSVPERAVVADSFHTKPLMRIWQSADRFQVLALSRSEIKLYEGNRDALDVAELDPRVPSTVTDALGEELTEPSLTASARRGGVGGEIFHGHGSKDAEVDRDAERFFRIIDAAVLEHHSRSSGLPLLLAALPEHQGLFRQMTRNPFLLPDGIDLNPDAVSIDGLRERAWSAVEPHFLARLARLVDAFQKAQAKGFGADDLDTIAEAAAMGRVKTLLLDADRVVPGRIDGETGRTEAGELERPDVDDLLDDLGEIVLGKSGEVVVVPGERMPTQTGAAAVFRY